MVLFNSTAKRQARRDAERPLEATMLVAEERRPVRCATYDYSSTGAYFITICVKGREPVFGRVTEEGQMVCSESGEIANQCLLDIPRHFPTVTIDASVVMPDHVHAILTIENAVQTVGIGHARSLRRQMDPQRTRPLETLPSAIGTYKSSVTRLVRASGNTAFQWQKSYHDHIVRDAEERERICAYIWDNPKRWVGSAVAAAATKGLHACGSTGRITGRGKLGVRDP
jgi:REP element-mobilizing transposase RayT